MKRLFAALAACGIFGAGFLAGSLSPMQTAQAQIGGAGPWPAAAAAPVNAGGTHFYAIDTGTRTLIACRQQDAGKPHCVREPLP